MIFPILNELSVSTRELLFYGGDTVFNRSISTLFQVGIQKQSTQALYTVPYFFCGYFVFSIIVNYFFTKKKNIGKTAVIGMLVIFAISIVFKPFIYVWHGFTYPILFTNRWTFVISFFLIITAAEKYQYLEYLSIKKMIIFVVSFLMLLTISYFIIKEEFNIFLFLINGFFCLSNLLLLNIILSYSSVWYKVGILVLFLIETIIVFKMNFLTLTSFKIEHSLSPYYSVTLNEELERTTNPGYRIGGSSIYQKNELFNTNFSRVNHFLSTVNGRITNFLKHSGYAASSSDFTDNPHQDLMNALLGIRYWYQEQPSLMYQKHDELHLENDIPLYENLKVPTFGYLIDKKYKNTKVLNPFTYQNSFLESIGYFSLFKREKVTKLRDKRYQINTNGAKELYFYITDEGNNDYPKKLILNNKKIKEKYFTFLGILKISVDSDCKTHNLKIDGKGKIKDVYVYSLKEEKLNHMLHDLQQGEIYHINYNKNKLEFDVNVTDNKKDMLLTIPYENGWHIYVDHKKVNYQEFLDTFITFPLTNGKHHISMYFIPKYLFLGISISMFSTFLSILYLKRK